MTNNIITQEFLEEKRDVARRNEFLYKMVIVPLAKKELESDFIVDYYDETNHIECRHSTHGLLFVLQARIEPETRPHKPPRFVPSINFIRRNLKSSRFEIMDTTINTIFYEPNWAIGENENEAMSKIQTAIIEFLQLIV